MLVIKNVRCNACRNYSSCKELRDFVVLEGIRAAGVKAELTNDRLVLYLLVARLLVSF